MAPAALLLLGVLLAPSASASRSSRVVPELDPKSDAKFFGKDYPDDHRVVTPHHFDHPFPAVQDSGDFDKDYVKDENSDGGEWAAQFEYDKLRHDIDLKKMDVAAAKRKMEGEDHDLEEAEAREEAASKAAEEAEEHARAANKTEALAKEAEDAASVAEGDANKSAGNANMTLDECKEKLAAAKGRVQKLKEEAEAAERDRESKRKADGEVAAVKALDIAALEKAHAEAEKTAAGGKEKVEELEKELEELRKKAELAEHDHGEAEKSVEELKADLKKTEVKLDEAAEKLRSVRKTQVNSGGGVFRSSASIARPLVALLVAALAAIDH